MEFLCYCFHNEAEISKSTANYKTDLSLTFCTGNPDREGGGFVEDPLQNRRTILVLSARGISYERFPHLHRKYLLHVEWAIN